MIRRTTKFHCPRRPLRLLGRLCRRRICFYEIRLCERLSQDYLLQSSTGTEIHLKLTTTSKMFPPDGRWTAHPHPLKFDGFYVFTQRNTRYDSE